MPSALGNYSSKKKAETTAEPTDPSCATIVTTMPTNHVPSYCLHSLLRNENVTAKNKLKEVVTSEQTFHLVSSVCTVPEQPD